MKTRRTAIITALIVIALNACSTSHSAIQRPATFNRPLAIHHSTTQNDVVVVFTPNSSSSCPVKVYVGIPSHTSDPIVALMSVAQILAWELACSIR